MKIERSRSRKGEHYASDLSEVARASKETPKIGRSMTAPSLINTGPPKATPRLEARARQTGVALLRKSIHKTTK